MPTIAILGTMDTKGVEHAFVAELIKQRGHKVLVIDVGTMREPRLRPDITRGEVAAAAGVDFAQLAAKQDRGESVTAMSRGAPIILARLVEEKRIDGVISLGGGGGTAVATAAMRALPIGFPKLMVSTLASGNVAPYVGVKDIVMFPSVVDIAGLNRISREILRRATGAICGMVEVTQSPTDQNRTGQTTVPPDKPIIVASQFGNTTRCIEQARALLEAAGYEVIVFAATGVGGRTMESLIETGLVAGVLDITTTEWADELVGGVLTAGPTRLEAAARCGVPAVVSTGCLDMVNFGPPDTVPARFTGRQFYQHNPQVTLMRTTPDECAKLGGILAEKLNLSTGPVTVVLPLRGGSVIGASGGPFHDAAADAALFAALKVGLRADIPVQELDCTINDAPFAEAAATALLQLLRKHREA
ncbi:MAG: Tm-1-like ATP-binding domain-containing protein [Verrucomicrobia bacterium]|nr:Tm-1-like ATP-binding domain-containing protein [Verrucomicrobiota bacterium]